MPLQKGQWVPAAIFFTTLAIATPAFADTITIGGLITQNLADSGATAVANPGLNNVTDGDEHAVTLNFNGMIGSPGMYSLTSLLFADAPAGAAEGAFISGSMTITLVGLQDQFNVQGCLIDAVTCLSGNQLDLNFQIPAASLNLGGVTAQSISALLPLDLLEDGGNTEIQGNITGYTYTGATSGSVPEPSTMVFVGISLAGLAVRGIRKKNIRRKICLNAF